MPGSLGARSLLVPARDSKGTASTVGRIPLLRPASLARPPPTGATALWARWRRLLPSSLWLLWALFGGPPREGDDAYRAIFELAGNGQMLLDRDARIVEANGAAARIFGGTPRGLIGLRLFDVIAPAERETLRASLNEVDRSSAPARLPDSAGLSRAGLTIPIGLVIGRTTGRAPFRYLVVIRDLRERNELIDALADRAADLARSNRELQEFAYVASHDLQEPLRMIASYTQLLQKRYQGKLDSDADEFLTYAGEGAARMQQMVDDLLSYARLEHRSQPFRWCSLDAALDRALRALQAAVADAHATIRRDRLPSLEGDEVALSQLFQNLISNAIKFRADAPPVVAISARVGLGDVELTVADNGIGVEPAYHERIFRMFQRLNLRESYQGTGIGLAVCRKVVDRHGGRIWVESTGIRGEGTRIHVSLPIRHTDRAGVAIETAPRRAEIPPADAAARQMIEDRLKELV
jgi:PAS domain S-box-containing protein